MKSKRSPLIWALFIALKNSTFCFLILVFFSTKIYSSPNSFAISLSQDIEDGSYQLNLTSISGLDAISNEAFYSIEFLFNNPFIKPYPEIKITKKRSGLPFSKTFHPIKKDEGINYLSLILWNHKIKVLHAILFCNFLIFFLKNFNFIDKKFFLSIWGIFIEVIVALLLTLGIREFYFSVSSSIKNKINLCTLKNLSLNSQENIKFEIDYYSLQNFKFINLITLKKILSKENLQDENVLSLILEFIQFSPTELLAEVVKKTSSNPPLLTNSHKVTKNIFSNF